MNAVAAQRNLAAEVRAVEAGHTAVVINTADQAWRTRWSVVSDTYQGKRYEVALAARPWDDGETLAFVCTPSGRMAGADDHLVTVTQDSGVVPCMHAATVARRLERENLAKLVDGRWVATESLASRPDANELASVFEGLS